MVLGAVLSAGIGIAGSLFGGASQRSAAAAQRKEQKQIAQDRYEYDQEVYDWENDIAMQQYEWDVARIAQLRANEELYALDRATNDRLLINQALRNYEINQGAIYDEFIIGEELRMRQEQLTLQQAQTGTAINTQNQISQTGWQQAQLGVQAAELARSADVTRSNNWLDYGWEQAQTNASLQRLGIDTGQRIASNTNDLMLLGVQSRGQISEAALGVQATALGVGRDVMSNNISMGLLATQSQGALTGGMLEQQMNNLRTQAQVEGNNTDVKVLGIQAADARRRAAYEQKRVAMQTAEAVRGYMNETKQLDVEGDRQARELERQSRELMASLALDEKTSYLGWQLEQIASLGQDSNAANRAMTQQGSGTTSKRLAFEAAQNLGRRWAEQVILKDSREVRLATMNDVFNDDLALRHANRALQMQNNAERGAFAVAVGNLDIAELGGDLANTLSQTDARIAGLTLQSNLSNAMNAVDNAAVVNRVNTAVSENQQRMRGLQIENQFIEALGQNRIAQINDRLQTQLSDSRVRAKNIREQSGFLLSDAAVQGRLLGERSQYQGSKAKLADRNIVGQLQSGLMENGARFGGLADGLRYAVASGRNDYNTRSAVFSGVTMPGFELARRQGYRELEALKLQTQAVFDRTVTPYRPNQYFDPVKPIPGVEPRKGAITNYSGPSVGNIVGGALVSGATNLFNYWGNNGFPGLG